MMGRSPQCYIPSFVKIGLPEKNIFEGFLPYIEGDFKEFYYLWTCGHLCHVTWIIIQTFVPRLLGCTTRTFKPSSLGEENIVYRRTTVYAYTKSSPCEHNGSGQLKQGHLGLTFTYNARKYLPYNTCNMVLRYLY